jgi:hypothetical protein
VAQHQVGHALPRAPPWPPDAIVPEHDRIHALFRGHLAYALGGIPRFAPTPDPDLGEALGHPCQVPLGIGGFAGIGRFGRPVVRLYVQDQQLRFTLSSKLGGDADRHVRRCGGVCPDEDLLHHRNHLQSMPA